MKTILALLILIGCSTPPYKQPNYKPQNTINSEFIPYLEDYEYYYKGKVRHIPINFESLDGNTVGLCGYRNGKIFILIDPDYWLKSTELEKLQLFFHELGHCHLGRGHYNLKYSDECPISFMHKTTFDNDCIDRHFDAYIEELFK